MSNPTLGGGGGDPSLTEDNPHQGVTLQLPWFTYKTHAVCLMGREAERCHLLMQPREGQGQCQQSEVTGEKTCIYDVGYWDE